MAEEEKFNFINLNLYSLNITSEDDLLLKIDTQKYFKLLIYNATLENLNKLNFYDFDSSSQIIKLNSVEVSKNMIGISVEREAFFESGLENNIEINLNKENFKNYLHLNFIKNEEINYKNFIDANSFYFPKSEQEVIFYLKILVSDKWIGKNI